MSIIKSLVFLPTQQYTLVINFSLPLVLGLLIVMLLIIFVHPWVISLHIIKLILSMSNYQMEIKSLQIISEVFHVLDNVLYIPNFTFNLLSVAKLIDNLSCVIFFILIVVILRTKPLLKWLDQLRYKVDFIYSGFLPIKTFKSNLANLHISPILSISLQVISKPFGIFG